MCPGGRWVTAAWIVVSSVVPTAGCAAVQAVMLPSDLGATSIDVSGYPGLYQRTYRELFVTKCAFCHTTARAINAPYLELPRALQTAHASAGTPVESAEGI